MVCIRPGASGKKAKIGRSDISRRQGKKNPHRDRLRRGRRFDGRHRGRNPRPLCHPASEGGDTGKGLANAVFACGVYLANAAGVTLSESYPPYRPKSPAEKYRFQPGRPDPFSDCPRPFCWARARAGRSCRGFCCCWFPAAAGAAAGGGFGGGFGGFGGGMSGGGGAGRDF
jgi:hypothetical protein